jgi:hypothetical protein
MGDETWISHYEPDIKHQNMELKHPHSPTKKKLRTDPSVGKLTLQFFGTHKGYYSNIIKRVFRQ